MCVWCEGNVERKIQKINKQLREKMGRGQFFLFEIEGKSNLMNTIIPLKFDWVCTNHICYDIFFVLKFDCIWL